MDWTTLATTASSDSLDLARQLSSAAKHVPGHHQNIVALIASFAVIALIALVLVTAIVSARRSKKKKDGNWLVKIGRAFDPTRPKSGMLLFVAFFMLIGAGVQSYRSFANPVNCMNTTYRDTDGTQGPFTFGTLQLQCLRDAQVMLNAIGIFASTSALNCYAIQNGQNTADTQKYCVDYRSSTNSVTGDFHSHLFNPNPWIDVLGCTGTSPALDCNSYASTTEEKVRGFQAWSKAVGNFNDASTFPTDGSLEHETWDSICYLARDFGANKDYPPVTAINNYIVGKVNANLLTILNDQANDATCPSAAAYGLN